MWRSLQVLPVFSPVPVPWCLGPGLVELGHCPTPQVSSPEVPEDCCGGSRCWKGKHSKTVLLVCQPLPWLALSPRLGDTRLCRRADRHCVVSGAQGAGLFEQTVRGALSVAQCPRLWDLSVGGKTLRLMGTLPCALLSVWVRPAHLPCSLLPPDCSFELCRTFSRTSTCLPLLDPSSV